ncbi:hypothetical protein fugu_012145, partial [Takifugu bimaculatus]
AVEVRRLTSVFTQLKAGIGLKLQYDGRGGRVYLQLDSRWRGQTLGLCGTFNGNLRDDFLSPAGMIEGTPQLHANAWKISSACVAPVNQPIIDPCELNQNNVFYASQCEVLMGSVFSPCHGYISPNIYQQQCRYQACHCGSSCLCTALAHYAYLCSKHGVRIDFRSQVSECGVVCLGGMLYHSCVSSCGRSCRALSGTETCNLDDCAEGCGCPDGSYYDDVRQRCVQLSQCHCYSIGGVSQPGEVTFSASGPCLCRNGKMECVPEEKEPDSGEVGECPEGKVYHSCAEQGGGVACAPTCRNLMLNLTCPPSTPCISGCVCPPGLVLHQGRCYYPENCPCGWLGLEYLPGETVEMPCYKCVCHRGYFNCTYFPCPAVCTIYSDRHYHTFDGLEYDYHTDCQVYLLKSVGETEVSIVAQNKDCYESGIVCIKFLVIHVGLTKIYFTDNSGNPSPSTVVGRGSEFELWKAGYYTVVHFPNQEMTILWDHKTTVHITAGPRWKGLLTGLCGNFDSVTVNDMTTSSHMEVNNAQTFGDSWALGQPMTVNTTIKVFLWFHWNLQKGQIISLLCQEAAIFSWSTGVKGQSLVEGQPLFSTRGLFLPGFTSFELFGQPGIFLTLTRAVAQAQRYDTTDSFKVRGSFALEESSFVIPHRLMCEWRYQACASPCAHTCSDPDATRCQFLPPCVPSPNSDALFIRDAVEQNDRSTNNNSCRHTIATFNHIHSYYHSHYDHSTHQRNNCVHHNPEVHHRHCFYPKSSYRARHHFTHISSLLDCSSDNRCFYHCHSIDAARDNRKREDVDVFSIHGGCYESTSPLTTSTPTAPTSPSPPPPPSTARPTASTPSIHGTTPRNMTTSQATSKETTVMTDRTTLTDRVTIRTMTTQTPTSRADTTELVTTEIITSPDTSPTTEEVSTTHPFLLPTTPCTPPYSYRIDECAELICFNGELLLHNSSVHCRYNTTQPQCSLLGLPVLINTDPCCPQWQCPCRCTVMSDLRVITFDGNNVALYDNGSYILVNLPTETIIGTVEKCPTSQTPTGGTAGLCFKRLNITTPTYRIIINRLDRKVTVNYRTPRLPFSHHSLYVEDTGSMYLIQTPGGVSMQWYHSTGIMVLQYITTYNASVPTQGLCGCCDGNPEDDLRLPNGTVVRELGDMMLFLHAWRVPTTDESEHMRRIGDNCTTGDCSTCLSMLYQRAFVPCHSKVPPEHFCDIMWAGDLHYKDHQCDFLAAYVAVCYTHQVCISWRRHNFCPLRCPPGKEYQPCVSTCTSRTCLNREYYEESTCSFIREECVCRSGTILHRADSPYCVTEDRCVCTDNEGNPRAPGEVWNGSARSCCLYKCLENGSVVAVEPDCSSVPSLLCEREGEYVLDVVEEGACCPKKICDCNMTICDSEVPSCDTGNRLVIGYSTLSCCPEYRCECDPTACPPMSAPSCRDDQFLVEVRGEKPCCFTYLCVCESCIEPVPTCSRGEILAVDFNNTYSCCPHYYCVCDVNLCPESSVSCTPGLSLVQATVAGNCCPQYHCECRCEDSSLPVCQVGEVLVEIPDSSRNCGCPQHECQKAEVCLFQGVTVLGPGQSLVQYLEGELCYTVHCLHHRDPESGFNAMDVSFVNCSQKCGTHQVYEPSTDPQVCCGSCKNISCTFTDENRTTDLFAAGSSWVENCTRYDCVETAVGAVILASGVVCPPFNDTECLQNGGVVQSYVDGCCKTCKEDGKTCKRVAIRTTIRKDDCRSNAPVTVYSCDGKCPSATIFNFNINSHARFCKCCRESGLQTRSVILYCTRNSTIVEYSFQEPLDCSCQWN